MVQSPLSRMTWRGSLTLDNVDSIIQRLKEMLTGQKFTLVTQKEGYQIPPFVQTDTVLDSLDGVANEPIYVWHNLGNAMLLIHHSYGRTSIPILVTNRSEQGRSQNKNEISFNAGKAIFTYINNIGERIHIVFAIQYGDGI